MEAVQLRARKALPWQREKVRQINEALGADPVDLASLRCHALSPGGLLHTHIRKKAWPKMVAVDVYDIPQYQGPALSSHKERAQVVLDVNRCTKRIPTSFSVERRRAIQEQLTRVILRVLAEHRGLHYYQGLHDIVLTLLLVLGEEITYAVMDVLVSYHIRDYLDADMQRTKLIIGYLRPLLALENRELEHFLTRSECEYYFSLSWLITWFGHVVNTPEESYRLMDVFLASHPLMPVYVSAAIVLSRQSEVLSLDCDMASVHGLLSRIPEKLSYEETILHAVKLLERHPPSKLASEGRIKLRASTLVSTYPKFQRLTQNQRPDHILAHLPKPRRVSWLPWQSSLIHSIMLRLLVFAGPVIIAIVAYWLQRYFRTYALPAS